MQLLNQTDPSEQRRKSQENLTKQSQEQADFLTKLLLEKGAGKDNIPFTSPFQVAGQWAQALAGRNMMGQNAANYAALNATLPYANPGQTPSPAQPAPAQPAPDMSSVTDAPLRGSIDPGNGDARAPMPRAAVKPFSPDIQQAIKEGSAAAGVDPHMMAVFAHIESGGRAGPEADTGSYKGLLQLSDREMAEMSGGRGNVYNPKDNVMAAGLIMKRNGDLYQRQTGNPASPFDLYMMHQQGPGGYMQHVRNPDAPAWQNMYNTAEGQHKGPHWAQLAITGNGGHIGDTSQQFLDRWQAKFQRLAGGDHGAFTNEAPAQTPTQGPQMAQALPQPGSVLPGPGIQPGAPGQPAAGQVPYRPIPPYQNQEALARGVRSGMVSPDVAKESAAGMAAANQPYTGEMHFVQGPGGLTMQVVVNPITKQIISSQYVMPGQGNTPPSPGQPPAQGGQPGMAPAGVAPIPAAPATPANPVDQRKADLTKMASDPSLGGVPQMPLTSNDPNAWNAHNTAMTEYKESAPDYRKKFDELQTEGRNADNGLKTNEILQRIIKDPGFDWGTKGKIEESFSRIAGQLGYGNRAATLREAFNKLTGDQIAKLAQSDARYASLADTVRSRSPDLMHTREGSLFAAETFSRQMRQQSELRDLATTYAKSHNGRLDRGFDSVVQNYLGKYPVYTDDEINNALGELSKSAKAGGTGEEPHGMPTPKSQQEYDALKSGDKYIGSDGRIRTKR